MKFLQFKIHDTCQRMALKMMELKQANTALFDIWNNSQVYLGSYKHIKAKILAS